MPILIPSKVRPSWKSGFARSASESAYPNLWASDPVVAIPVLGNAGATAFDQSGFGNNGTLRDGATVVPAGKNVGFCYEFNGLGSAIDLSGAGTGPSDPWTICLWLRPHDTASGQYIHSSGGPGSNFRDADQIAIIVGFQSGYFNIYANNAYATADATDTQMPAVVNQWDHVAVVRDGDTLIGYLNGIEQFNLTPDTPSNWFLESDMLLGEYFYQHGSEFGYDGNVADYQRWNRALSAGEVKAIAEAPVNARYYRRLAIPTPFKGAAPTPIDFDPLGGEIGAWVPTISGDTDAGDLI